MEQDRTAAHSLLAAAGDGRTPPLNRSGLVPPTPNNPPTDLDATGGKWGRPGRRLVKIPAMPQLAAVNEAFAHQLAADWLAAWNQHDLDAIMAHYADDIEFTSPFVAPVLGDPGGVVRGKAALRDYFARALTAYPDLQFESDEVLIGVNSLALHYRSVKNLMAAEVMTFNAHHQIVRVLVHYAPAPAPVTVAPETPAREWRNGDYLLTDDPALLDLDAVCALLHSTYWADDRPRDVIAKAIRNSTCLSLVHDGQLVGFIRGVTDHATYTWVCDVIVHPGHRGKGLGKWIVQCFLEHPDLQTISHHLCTRDAHALYESFGFQRIEAMRRSDKPMPFLLA
jgi:GNAT superfamily N-acetyltransferase/ketosteroid isomerase-like protein